MVALMKWLERLGFISGRRNNNRTHSGSRAHRIHLGIERLEDRLTPALQLLYSGPGAVLSLNEVSAANDTVTVSELSPGLLRIDLGAATFAAGSSTVAGLTYQNAGSPTTSSFVDVNIAAAFAVSDLAIDLGAGSDFLTLGMTNAAGGVLDITVTDSVGSDTFIDLNSISLNLGNLSVTGGPIYVGPGVLISTLGGDITLNGTGSAIESFGILVEGGTLDAGGGDITLTGAGAAGTNAAFGIWARLGAMIQTGGNGAITLHGTGGSGMGGNVGVLLEGNGTQVTTADGDIDITGVGNGSGSANFGVRLLLDAAVRAGGSGKLTVRGTGGDGTFANHGVSLLTSQLTTADGDLVIIGTGGSGSEGENYGIHVSASSGHLVQAGGNGAITLHGTGGNSMGENIGVSILGNAQLTTMGGNHSITGVGGGTTTGNIGIRIGSDADVQAGGLGTLTLHGTGGNGLSSNWGVYITSAQVTTVGSDLSIIGFGRGTSGNNDGIRIEDALLHAGGSGKLTLTGTGSNGTGFSSSIGVRIGEGQVTTAGGDLSITGVGGSGTSNGNDGISISDFGTNVVVEAGGSGTLTLNGTGGQGADNNIGVRIVGSGTLVTTANANLVINGVGQGTGGTNSGIGIFGATVHAAGNGKLTLTGTGGNGTDFNSGVNLDSGQVTTDAGDLVITGVGNGSGNSNYGILANSPSLTVLVQAGGSGAVTLHGTGGKGTFSNVGVSLNRDTLVTTLDGDLAITGVGHGAGDRNHGIEIRLGASVDAGGDGNLTLHGTGGNGTGGNVGVFLESSGTQVTTANGDLAITGIGQGTDSDNFGIYIADSALAHAGGNGKLNLSGTGGNGTNANIGVFLESSGTQLTTTNGDLVITGVGRGTGLANSGIASMRAFVHAAGNGKLTLNGTGGNGSDFNFGIILDSGQVTTNAGDLALTGVGNGAGSNDGIAVINSGVVQAGGSGTVTLNGIATIANMNAGVRITSGGRVTAGGGDITKTLGLALGSAIVVSFDPARTLAAGYEYVNVDGTVDLGGADLRATKSGTISTGDQFLLLNNDLAEPITGMFAQGSSITVANQSFALAYAAGVNNNDVVATAAEALSITTASLPSWTQGVQYTSAVSATGGTGAITFAVTAGAIPTGLTLNGDGTFSGSPSATGMFTFTVTATDSLGATAARTYANVTINAPVSITTATLPNGVQGAPYRPVVASTGGTGARTYAVAAGVLPTGLALNSDGTFSGTPSTRGTFRFTITATDAVGGIAARAFTVAINIGAAATFRFVRQPRQALAGTVLAPVVVQLTDRFGNAVARAGVAVTIRLSGGRLFGTVTRRTDAQGRASFNDLRIVPPGRYRLTVFAAGLIPAASAPLSIGPNPLSRCFWA